jgi:hypothetical protein
MRDVGTRQGIMSAPADLAISLALESACSGFLRKFTEPTTTEPWDTWYLELRGVVLNLKLRHEELGPIAQALQLTYAITKLPELLTIYLYCLLELVNFASDLFLTGPHPPPPPPSMNGHAVSIVLLNRKLKQVQLTDHRPQTLRQICRMSMKVPKQILCWSKIL